MRGWSSDRSNPLASRLLKRSAMRGFITDHHLDEADAEFPGIRAFYYSGSAGQPRTFLELVARFLAFSTTAPTEAQS